MAYTPYIQTVIDYHEKEVEQLKGLEMTARSIEKVKARHEDVFHEVRTFGSDSLRVVLNPRSVNELATVLRTFRGNGMKIEEVKEKPEDQKRTYHLAHADERLNKHAAGSWYRRNYPVILVDAHFNAADGECKYVQVDTIEETVEAVPAVPETTVTKPVFELQCGGEAAEVLV